MAEKKRKKSKKGIILGVIVAVVVVLGAGFWFWHNTPNFCGTACHDTMGEHLANFEGTDATKGAGLASLHGKEKLGCLDCHEAELSVQIAELKAQFSGVKDNLGLADRYYIDNAKCLSCHEGTYDKLLVLTEDLGDYNPHNSPHGQLNCNECHKGHAAQVDTCGQCHPNGGQEMVA